MLNVVTAISGGFFTVQDPLRILPPERECPLWKVQSFLEEIKNCSKDAWLLGKFLSTDEQTISFQGRHQDKLRINYKRAGDGFQADSICDAGYTFTFYFRNEKIKGKHKDQSELYARCLCMFDELQDKYHQINVDNLYTSDKFCWLAWNSEKRYVQFFSYVLKIDY